MKKEEYCRFMAVDGNAYVEKVVGYVDELEIGGKAYRFGIHKDKAAKKSQPWTVTELGTGYTTASSKFRTYAEASEFVSSQKHVEQFGRYVEVHACRYEAQCRMLAELAAADKPLPIEEHNRLVEQWTDELAAEVLAKSVANIAEAAEAEQATAAAVTVETMREWCEDKEGLRVEQAAGGDNPEKNPIWVCGPSKPYKEELMGMGFRWGRSKKFGKGWHYDPSRVA